MKLQIAIPKLEQVIQKANDTGLPQCENFLLNELKTYDGIDSAISWLIDKGISFETNKSETRYTITINPKQ